MGPESRGGDGAETGRKRGGNGAETGTVKLTDQLLGPPRSSIHFWTSPAQPVTASQ